MPRHHSWICLGELVLGGWAHTLRAAVLGLVVMLGLVAALGAAWGVLAATVPLVLGIGVAIRLIRPHLSALNRS